LPEPSFSAWKKPDFVCFFISKKNRISKSGFEKAKLATLVLIRKQHRENRETMSIDIPQKFSRYFGWLVTLRCVCDVKITPRLAPTAANKLC